MKRYVVTFVTVLILAGGILVAPALRSIAAKAAISPVQTPPCPTNTLPPIPACGDSSGCRPCYSNQGTLHRYPTFECQDSDQVRDNAELAVNNSCIITGGTPSGTVIFYGFSHQGNLWPLKDDWSIYAKRTCDKCTTVAGGGSDPCSGVNCGDPNSRYYSDSCCYSPILIDVAGNGFQLTDAHEGVFFDLDSDGKIEHISWTEQGSDDSFLALDRNGDGRIDVGSELFGNFTDQPNNSGPKNGFAALAEFDDNHDGVIDEKDQVFSRLLLWRDYDHCGHSDGQELSSLALVGITSIDLDYKLSARQDRYRNTFRYRAKVHFGDVERFAYDVFFKKGN